MILLATQTIQNNTQAPTFLGESWGFWCQFIVITITAVIAIYTLRTNEKRARRRATIDLVLSENQDEKFRDIKEKYSIMREKGVNFTLLSCDPDDSETRKQEIADQKETIIAILNQYEFIASAIFENSLDENLYKRMKKSVLIREWEVLSGFVSELRRKEGRDKLFCETENLALKWKKEKK